MEHATYADAKPTDEEVTFCQIPQPHKEKGVSDALGLATSDDPFAGPKSPMHTSQPNRRYKSRKKGNMSPG